MTTTPPRRLLVVDDESGIRDVVAMIARRLSADLDVVTAATADEAEQIVARGGIDGVLTDLRMPGRSGIDLLQSVSERSVGTRRALMTGFHEDIIDGVPLASLDLVAVLRKPFSVSEVRGVIGRLTEG